MGTTPKHIAIIPDGNRRWAKAHKLLSEKGHRAGLDLLIELSLAAKEFDVASLTFYLFSTENWNRSKREVSYLLALFKRFLKINIPVMKKNGIRLTTLGNLTVFSDSLRAVLQEAVQETAPCEEIEVTIALNYGGRDEMQRAVRSIVEDCASKKIDKTQIDASLISSYLDTAGRREPDLLIRAGGEKRLSNFLLWQMAYTELYFCDKLWPDFTAQDLFEAISDFQQRKRRWGGT
jgi:undecaprenyl diphosphate synthase